MAQQEPSGVPATDAHTTPKLRYRYGNKLLGQVDARTKVSGIAILATFNKVWRNDTELNKLMPRSWMPFAKCDICVAHRTRLATSQTEAERDSLMREIENHVNMVRAEKGLYYDNRDRARRDPRKFMSVIIDGADSTLHELPHFREISKLSSQVPKVKMHVYGALVHGFKSFVSIIPDHEAQGHNVTINMLWTCITEFYKDRKYRPDVLFMQLDNTTKQNKGQYLYGFLALLVERGIFKKVVLSFLPKGHTHEDIDQMFSRMVKFLKAYDAFTREELAKLIERCFTFEGKSPTVFLWDTMANMKDYLEPYMQAETGKPSTEGITQFRHFRFIMREEGPALQARHMMASSFSDEGWLGLKPYTFYT